MIYSDGTTNLVSGSAIVRGTGTQWKANINGIAAGQIISIQSGNTVIQNVIQSVNSDTELVLAFAPSVSLNNAKYVISTTVPDTVSDGVRHMVAINAYIILFLQNMDRWMSENGKVEVEMPNGQKVTLDSIRALQAAMDGKLAKGQNGADIQNKSEFLRNIGAATQAAVEGKLEKSQDGADIPNKPEFVKNIGLGDALRVGDYGLGTSAMNAQSFMEDMKNTKYKTGFYGYSPSTASQVGHHGSVIKTSWSSDNHQLIILPNYGNAVMYVQRCDSNKWSTYTVMTSNMWTVDGSGYYKKSSPIIQIYPDGTFTTNDESEGATVTKLGLGHYKISGILGYNADGAWGVHGGISVPRDVNGNELVYVEDKVLPDGAIEIKVTHRQNAHMPARLQNRRMKSQDEQTHYTDDEPCDLPAGTRLDVRVQMPEDSIWNQKQVLVSNPQQEHSSTSAVNK
ncbi:hypothetical protein L7G72_04145 [Xenorhabdus bovienii]|uniref:phage tail fiber protein n=1 Tax=Xenorhabdus bovienii TaxID=40576 RepID=UPI001EDE8DA9|nr:hypothetical protein [Xenorhabdus bovienii]MCG3461054.1 hypothetical protein [Xenorhabdus bovienii]